MVRFQAALTLAEGRHDPRAIKALAGIALRDSGDLWTRSAVLIAIGPDSPALLETLAKTNGFFDTESGRVWLDELATLIGAQRDPALLRRLVNHLTPARSDARLMIRLLVAANRGSRRTGPLSDSHEVDWPALVGPFREEARGTALSDCPLDRRVPAVELLGIVDDAKARETLASLLDARQTTPVQLAALKALGISIDSSVAKLVLSQWKTMSPTVRREAAELLFSRRDRLEHLLSALDSRSFQLSEIDADRLKKLRAHRDPQIRARVEKILGSEDRMTTDRKATINAFRQALTLPGKPDSGRSVFQKACATCHRVLGQGVEVGPDLATVASRSPDDLLMHILDPNREVASNYVNYNVATTDGRTSSGIIVSESATALTLKRAEGVTEVIPRGQIEDVASTGVSLMPEGLEKGLSPQDLADLMAFVKSIQHPSISSGLQPGR
jgi:putative heme-binding domain-containing protein